MYVIQASTAHDLLHWQHLENTHSHLCNKHKDVNLQNLSC